MPEFIFEVKQYDDRWENVLWEGRESVWAEGARGRDQAFAEADQRWPTDANYSIALLHIRT